MCVEDVVGMTHVSQNVHEAWQLRRGERQSGQSIGGHVEQLQGTGHVRDGGEEVVIDE